MFSICKLWLPRLHRWGSQKFTDYINEEKENLQQHQVSFSDAVPAIPEGGKGERSPSFSSSEISKTHYFSLDI